MQFAAVVPGVCSLIKYSYQIRSNIKNRSVAGISPYAIWSDFLGNAFCGTQLQIDSMLAGYAFFGSDPRFNLAKALIAIFGTVNTIVILIQMYVVYRQVSKSLDDEFPETVDSEIGRFSFNLKQIHKPLLGRKTRTYSESLDETGITSARSQTTDAESTFIKSSSSDK